MDYDPNMHINGGITKQTVRLTFAQWQYCSVKYVEVIGNCTGKAVIDVALTNFYNSLEGDFPEIIFQDTKTADQIIETDDDQRGEPWLQEMLVSADIVSVERINENPKKLKKHLKLIKAS